MSENGSPPDPRLQVRSLLGQATIRRARSQPGDALKLAQQALSLDQDNPEILELVGDILMDLNRGADAFASYQQARKLLPNRVVLEDKLARAALGRAAKLRSAEIAEAVLAGTYQPTTPGRKPDRAALLSLVPGLGQLYNGDIVKGIILIAAYIASWAMIVLSLRSHSASGLAGASGLASLLSGSIIWILLLIALIVYAMLDAGASARKAIASEKAGLLPR